MSRWGEIVSRNTLAVLLFLSGVASVITFLGPALLPVGVPEVVKPAGPILFVATLAWTLKMVATRLERFEEFHKKLSTQVDEFSKAEHHGHAIQDLQRLSQMTDPTGTVSAASRVFLRLASADIPAMADGIQGYQKGRELRIAENYIVSNVLAQLPSNLPEGAIWLGVSKLVGGWDETADPSFTQFIDDLHRLAYSKRIRIFRIYYARTQDMPHVRMVAERFGGPGVESRVLPMNGADIPDMSVVMGLRRPSQLNSCKTPRDAIEHGDPLYAMEFDVVNGALLHSVEFVTGKSARFQTLLDTFTVNWNRATSPTSPPPIS